MDEAMEIILVGGFHETLELAESAGCRVLGIIDNHLQGEYYGYPVLGKDEDAVRLYRSHSHAAIVVTPDLPAIRRHLVHFYRKIGWIFASLIHPQAMISRHARLGSGIVIQYGVNISANVHVSDYVKINTYANIMHDVNIGDFSTIAPNAVVLGRVNIGSSCYIGANATILPDKSIGDAALVGAAAVVTRNIPAGCKVAGVPAREMT